MNELEILKSIHTSIIAINILLTCWVAAWIIGKIRGQ